VKQTLKLAQDGGPLAYFEIPFRLSSPSASYRSANVLLRSAAEFVQYLASCGIR
jgi:hypothetical protein